MRVPRYRYLDHWTSVISNWSFKSAEHHGSSSDSGCTLICHGRKWYLLSFSRVINCSQLSSPLTLHGVVSWVSFLPFAPTWRQRPLLPPFLIHEWTKGCHGSCLSHGHFFKRTQQSAAQRDILAFRKTHFLHGFQFSCIYHKQARKAMLFISFAVAWAGRKATLNTTSVTKIFERIMKRQRVKNSSSKTALGDVHTR